MRRNTAEFDRTIGAYLAIGAHPELADEIADAFRIDRPVPVEQRPPRRSFLYLLATQCEDMRYFKIGRSVQPDIRLQQIQSGKGAKMPPGWKADTLVQPLAIRAGGQAEERRIHHDLREDRILKTEWFIARLGICHYIVAEDAWDEWDGSPISVDYDFTVPEPPLIGS